ncbi:MAG: superantigen-like protein [Staphylococcus capitis]|nr:MAG: superantigen-like protein [Staphylococcus capitis]
MKLKTLAKATLALGLLTTGVITSEGQAVHAKEKQERVQHLYDIKDLYRYYSSESFEFSNISGKVENYNGSNVVRFNQEKQNHQLFLLGKDKVNKVYGGNLDASIDSFLINKEEVSLKELDFKIRKQLVEKYGLYKGTTKYGKITINLKDEKKEVIDLGDKLQFERMGDVLNSKDIQNIAVTINQI